MHPTLVKALAYAAAHRAACERLDAVQVPTLIPPDRSRQSSLL